MKPGDYNDTFQGALARMERDLFTDMPDNASMQSIAISLKRIADMMELREARPYTVKIKRATPD